ncbi:DUF4231 domain-containing protein [Actinopolymorpha pittospori]|uniref:DUF4231 domain-containing protein n=1 Tax=Actinopolymorpha pittospori TaxID=648752 RepID=A0A927MUB1_9ACTN|nr:DUF4231 domain-containing protein [Actinopolymorpha pittospori]MBE1605393.1 hypothetical protein [Actinopolymorpha pittospori]
MGAGEFRDFPTLRDSPAEQMATRRFGWYARQARLARLAYWSLSLVQLAAAVVIASSAAFDSPRWTIAILGALIALAEGVRSLFRVQEGYLAYRVAAERLRNEAWLFAQRAGDYAGAADPHGLLAERVVEVSSHENATWTESLRGGKSPAAGA